MHAAAQRPAGAGTIYALLAFGFWGLNPVYFKAIAQVAPLEVLGHRIVWSVFFVAILLTALRRWPGVLDALCNWRTLGVLLATTVIVAGNWLLYIWAIAIDRVLETSLGYFINPLVNMLLGFVFLGERLRRWQVVAVGLAAGGVLNLAIAYGSLPWISLGLAASFGIYGLLRKIVAVESLDGLFVETLLLLPFALGFLLWLEATGTGHLGHGGLGLDVLLALSGPVTALPLIWFTAAARRLRLAVLGFFQYIAPSGQFLLAVFVYDEPFTRAHLVTFLLIWTAIAIFLIESLRPHRRRTAAGVA